MKPILTIFCLVLLSGNILLGQTYISNINVIDVENQQIIPNRSVVIEGELISHIYPNKEFPLAEGAKVIDGTGKFLMPGLTDAHIHFFQSGGLYTRPDAIDLRTFRPFSMEIDYSKDEMENLLHRYLKLGITNLIDVGSTYELLKEKEKYAERSDVPSISMSGPLLTTYLPPVYEGLGDDSPFRYVASIEDGIQGVEEQIKHKPDFIKIWYITKMGSISPEVGARKNLPIIQAIIKKAHEHNLKVAVHATELITAQLAIESGCDFLVHNIDDQLVSEEFVQLVLKNKTILCPTIVVHKGYNATFGQKLEFTNYELLTSDPFQLGTLLDLKHIKDTVLVANYQKYANDLESIQRSEKRRKTMMANLKKLSDAGVTIATGTDAGNIGTLHASSYSSELEAMAASGMDNWDIIQASTINGAKILNQESEFGSIVEGKKANMIILNSNPIDDLANLKDIEYVLNKGQIFNPDSLIQDSPSDLAQRQLNAYNHRNIDAFLEPYSDDVEVYTYPDQLMYTGKENMRARYSEMFKNVPDLHCELVDRIVQGNIVIDKEHVNFGTRQVDAVAIYHIIDNKIGKVYFIK